MTQNTSQAKSNDNDQNFDLADLGIDGPGQQSDSGYTLEDFLPILVNLLMTRRHLTAAPAFTPKTFVDQVQLFDDGTNRRLYLYINRVWRYVALT
jgi:hypothetical protein